MNYAHRFALAALALVPLALGGVAGSLLSCSSGTGGSGGGGSGGGKGGGGAGDPNDRYTRVVLDSASQGDRGYLAMAVDPAQQRVGVIYLVGSGYVDDGGATPDYQWRYVEWKDGVVSPPETVATVKRFVGVDLAFQANGQPVATYLGGTSDMSAYWFQSDGVLTRRAANGTWAEEVVVNSGRMAMCPGASPGSTNPVSNIEGIVEGLWPAVLVNGSTEYLLYRDGHNGEFPLQDWAGSDVEVAKGGQGNWQHVCVNQGGDGKGAWGGHIRAVFDANKRPGVIYDKMPGGSDTVGNDVYFQHENVDGTWSNALPVISVANTQTGASLAFDSQAGFGVAVINKNNDTLYYTHSTDLGAHWASADSVVGSGSNGWYPSLAFDPATHEPAIAYYTCSRQAGAVESSCRPDEDQLVIAQRNENSNAWNEEIVDAEGGSIPRLGFLPNGKRVVAYRARGTNVVKLAVEK